MGVTMRVRKGVRPKNGTPKIVFRQKVSLVKVKDKDGNVIWKFVDARNVSNTANNS